MSYRNNKNNNNNNFKKIIMNNNNNTKLIRKYISNSNTPKKGVVDLFWKNHKYKIIGTLVFSVFIILIAVLIIKGVFNSSGNSKSETQIKQELEAQAAKDEQEKQEKDENTRNQNKADRTEILNNILKENSNIQIIEKTNVPLSKRIEVPSDTNESIQTTIQNLISDISTPPKDADGNNIEDIIGIYYHIGETDKKITYFYITKHFVHKKIDNPSDDYKGQNEQHLLFKKEYSELVPVIHAKKIAVHVNNNIPTEFYPIPSGSKNNSVPENTTGTFSNTKPPQKNTNYYNNMESFNTIVPDVCFENLKNDDLISSKTIEGGEDILEIHLELKKYLDDNLKTEQDPKIYWVKIITTYDFDTNKFNYIITFYKKGTNIQLKTKSENTNHFCYKNNSQFVKDTINELNANLVIQKQAVAAAEAAKKTATDALVEQKQAVAAAEAAKKTETDALFEQKRVAYDTLVEQQRETAAALLEKQKEKEAELAHYEDQVQNIFRDDIINKCKEGTSVYNLITKKSYNLDNELTKIRKLDYMDTDVQPMYEVNHSRYLKQFLLKNLPDILKNKDNTDVLDKSNPIYLADTTYEYKQYDSNETDDKYSLLYISCFFAIPIIFGILMWFGYYLKNNKTGYGTISGIVCGIIFFLGVLSIPILALTNNLGNQSNRNQISFKSVKINDNDKSIFSHFISDKNEENCSKYVIKPKIFYVEKPSHNYNNEDSEFNGTKNIIFVIFDGKVKTADLKVSFPNSNHKDHINLLPFEEKITSDGSRTGITDIYKLDEKDKDDKEKILTTHKNKLDFYNRRIWYVKSEDVENLGLESNNPYNIKFENDIEYESDQYLTDHFADTEAETARNEAEKELHKLIFYGVRQNTEVSFNVNTAPNREIFDDNIEKIDELIKSFSKSEHNFDIVWEIFIGCYGASIGVICLSIGYIFFLNANNKRNWTKDGWYISFSIFLIIMLTITFVSTWVLFGILQAKRKNMYSQTGTIDLHKGNDDENFKSLKKIDDGAYEHYRYTNMELKSDIREDMSFEAKLDEISIFNPNLIYKRDSKIFETKYTLDTTEMNALKNKYEETKKKEDMENYKNKLDDIKTKLDKDKTINTIDNKIIFNMKEFIKMDQNIPEDFILGTIKIGTTSKEIKYIKTPTNVKADANFAYLTLSDKRNANNYHKQIEITIPTGIIKLDEEPTEKLLKIVIDLKSILIDVQKSAKPLIFENTIEINSDKKITDLKTKLTNEFKAYKNAVNTEMNAVTAKIDALPKDETSGTTESDEDGSKSTHYHIITSIFTVLLIIGCTYFFSNKDNSFKQLDISVKFWGSLPLNILFSLLAIVFNLLLHYKQATFDIWMWSYVTVGIIYILAFIANVWVKITFLDAIGSIFSICAMG